MDGYIRQALLMSGVRIALAGQIDSRGSKRNVLETPHIDSLKQFTPEHLSLEGQPDVHRLVGVHLLSPPSKLDRFGQVNARMSSPLSAVDWVV